MSYEIGATEHQREIFIKTLQKGFNLSQALLRASIQLYVYKTWYKNYLLKEYIQKTRNNISDEEWAEMNTDGFIKDLSYTPSAKELRDFENNKEFHDFVCKCHEIVNEVRRAPLILEDFLLSKALTEGNKQWTASAWLLERLYKHKYAEKEQPSETKPVAPVNVEFVKSDEQEDRIKAMEQLVDREINGESKA